MKIHLILNFRIIAITSYYCFCKSIFRLVCSTVRDKHGNCMVYYSVAMDGWIQHNTIIISNEAGYWYASHNLWQAGTKQAFLLVESDQNCESNVMMRSSKINLSSRKIKTQFSFPLYVQYLGYIMLKTTTRLNVRFQRYSHFSDVQNNKIQRKLNPIIVSIYKSDSFCLITSHLFLTLLKLGPACV